MLFFDVFRYANAWRECECVLLSMWIAWLHILATHPFLIILLLFLRLCLSLTLFFAIAFLVMCARMLDSMPVIKGTHKFQATLYHTRCMMVRCHQFSAQINVYDEPAKKNCSEWQMRITDISIQWKWEFQFVLRVCMNRAARLLFEYNIERKKEKNHIIKP